MAHKYTLEQIEWIRDNRDYGTYYDLALMFNSEFKVNINGNAISNACSRYKIKCSENHVNRAYFKNGHTSWNTGLKGVNGSGNNKKGIEPHNKLPNGSERIKADGYIDVKVDNEWINKNRVVWEEHNGPIPDNHIIVFLDSDTTNCDIENLALVSRAELIQLNKNDNFKSQRPDIKKALIDIVRFELETNKLKMKNKKYLYFFILSNKLILLRRD